MCASLNALDDHPEEVDNDLAHGQISGGGVQLQKTPLHRINIMFETLDRFFLLHAHALVDCLLRQHMP